MLVENYQNNKLRVNINSTELIYKAIHVNVRI